MLTECTSHNSDNAKPLVQRLFFWHICIRNPDFTAKEFNSNIYIVHNPHTNICKLVGIAALTFLLN